MSRNNREQRAIEMQALIFSVTLLLARVYFCLNTLALAASMCVVAAFLRTDRQDK